MTRIDGFMKIKAKIRDVEAGGRHCLAITEEDPEMNTARELYGWGFNFYHQLGLGENNREDILEPIKIEIGEDIRKIKHISCGYFFSAVIAKN